MRNGRLAIAARGPAPKSNLLKGAAHMKIRALVAC